VTRLTAIAADDERRRFDPRRLVFVTGVAARAARCRPTTASIWPPSRQNGPKVDLEINFDYNSAASTPRAEPQPNNLGQALTSGEIAGSVFMLGGHTDAKGGDQYNQALSERRAETVKRFLMEKHHLPAANLVSAGYGKKKGLKNASDPFAAESRRVEIVNMADRNRRRGDRRWETRRDQLSRPSRFLRAVDSGDRAGLIMRTG
jgi:outer membrane protein OmpA-like peptidoglycan-associated protein